MEQPFVLAVTEEDRRFLLHTARVAILDCLKKQKRPVPAPGQECSKLVSMELGAFVTLELDGTLRGCIGQLTGQGPLYATVARMACAAAFKDHRFAPLTAEEAEQVTLSISIMGPVCPCPDATRVKVGRHGLVVQRGAHTGLLLPQVAVERGWDREMFLDQTCCKAGLAPGVWRVSGTALYWFEAVVIR